MNAVVFWWLSSWLVAGVNANAPDSAAATANPTPPVPLAIEVTGECPTRDAVMAALLPVLGVEPPARRPREPPRVVDAGERFEVRALGQSQQYVDAERNCAERARVAAVFIVLALNPPTFEMPPPPPRIEKVEPPPPPPPPPPPRGNESWASVALGARLDSPVSPTSGASDGVPVGGELRVAIGWRRFGILASAGALAPTERMLSSVAVREQRFPVSVSASLRHQPSRIIEISAALGLSLVPLTLRGQGLGTSSPATRFDAGARAGLELRLPNLAGHLAPFIGVHAEYFPRPYLIEVDPLGNIGSTAKLWIGGTAGFAFEMAR